MQKIEKLKINKDKIVNRKNKQVIVNENRQS